jgi:hypothetical protein
VKQSGRNSRTVDPCNSLISPCPIADFIYYGKFGNKKEERNQVFLSLFTLPETAVLYYSSPGSYQTHRQVISGSFFGNVLFRFEQRKGCTGIMAESIV